MNTVARLEWPFIGWRILLGGWWKRQLSASVFPKGRGLGGAGEGMYGGDEGNSRERTETPVGEGTKERQLEHHELPFISTLHWILHTRTIFFFCLSNIFLPRHILSPLSLMPSLQCSLTFLSVFKVISSPIVPPPPLCSHQPHTLLPIFAPPGSLCFAVVFRSDTGDRSTFITSGYLANKPSAILDRVHHYSLQWHSLHTHWLRKGR